MQTRSVDEFERKCRAKGLALTVQRRTILQELLQRYDHPTADMIYDSVKDRVPGISRTTVYRVLDTLVQLGAARKVAHEAAVVRFDPNTERHHHLLCDRCGSLLDLPPQQVGSIPLPDTTASGFTIRDFTVNFSGTCLQCRDDQIGFKE
jgi:Fur family transcriptional regulator, peroxide stress response regulator